MFACTLNGTVTDRMVQNSDFKIIMVVALFHICKPSYAFLCIVASLTLREQK